MRRSQRKNRQSYHYRSCDEQPVWNTCMKGFFNSLYPSPTRCSPKTLQGVGDGACAVTFTIQRHSFCTLFGTPIASHSRESLRLSEEQVEVCYRPTRGDTTDYPGLPLLW